MENLTKFKNSYLGALIKLKQKQNECQSSMGYYHIVS